MTSFRSWNLGSSSGGGGSGGLFKLSSGLISSINSKPLDIQNYVRADNFYTRSDLRLKENISNINITDLDKLNLLIPKSYNVKKDNSKHYGFIAQEVEKLFPNLVNVDDNGMKSVNYLEIIPLLLLKVNDLERKIDEIKNNK